MSDLSGKYALVTGGASGIGKSITEKFISGGARVVVFDRDRDALNLLRSEHRDDMSGDQWKLKCPYLDISNPPKVNEAFFEESFSRKLPKLDILVNNAGVDKSFDWLNPDNKVWNDMINTNINGTAYVTSHVLKQMVDNGKKGSLIFITSIHNAQAFPGGGAYDATKHALVGMMKNIALEFGKYGIRSNAIAPGSIADAGPTANISETLKKHFEGSIPLGRLGTATEIANAALFLASDESSYITGTQIRVDGGSSVVSDLFNGSTGLEHKQ